MQQPVFWNITRSSGSKPYLRPVHCFPLLLVFPRFLIFCFTFPVSRFLFHVSRFTTSDPTLGPVPVRISDAGLRIAAVIPIPRCYQRFRSPFRSPSPVPVSGPRFRFPVPVPGSSSRFRFPFLSSSPLLAVALLAAARFVPAPCCFIKNAALDHGQSLG